MVFSSNERLVPLHSHQISGHLPDKSNEGFDEDALEEDTLLFLSARVNLFVSWFNYLFVCLFVYLLFQAVLQLARIYLTVDDLDASQQRCVQLLKMDAENDDATVVSTAV